MREGVTDINTSLKGPGVNGRLIVKSDVPGVVAFLKGEKPIALPFQIDLPRGSYEFSFYLHDHEPEFREVVLQSGDIKDLGVIHFEPEPTKFDADATYDFGAVLTDPYRFLDREFWVTASVTQPKEPPKVARSGDGTTYVYFFLYAPGYTMSNPHYYLYLDSGLQPPDMMGRPNQRPFALGRLRPEQASPDISRLIGDWHSVGLIASSRAVFGSEAAPFRHWRAIRAHGPLPPSARW